jgi:hypothetical protein
MDELEVWVDGAWQRVPLEGEELTIGQSAGNDLPLPFDRTVSRLHAVVSRVGSGWSIRDLSSRNGTFVNGERIVTERPLHSGDEIRVGSVRLLIRLEGATPDDATIGAEAAPELTRREREVLVALCRPVMSGDVFREPATIRQIAEQLFVTEAAVKQHISRLYDKFGLYDREGRRARLANEAIRRGVVTAAEIAGARPAQR